MTAAPGKARRRPRGPAGGSEGAGTGGRAPARLQALFAELLSPEPHRGPAARTWVQAAMILTAAALFGFQFVALKKAFVGIGPLSLLASRALIALPLQVGMMRWAGAPLRMPRRDLLLLAVPATLLMVSQVLFMLGVHRLSAGLTSTLGSTVPLFSLALGFLSGIERGRPVAYAGALAAVAGVTLATGATSGHADGLGIGLVVACNATYAAALLSHKRLALRLSSAWFTNAMIVQTVLVVLPLAGGVEGLHVDWTWDTVLGTLYSGVVGQVTAYMLVMTIVRYAGVFQATLVTPLIPVWAILFAVLLLGEPLPGREVAGAVLIVSGVVAAVLPAGTLRRLPGGAGPRP